ncbi:myb/SANT-like DNA-binding domain-containing protein 3 [Bombyx mandarina]|uniref:Regulatory protein zeste n=1 Tax=Bombyx mandarina TaxID=7092 RepID=A0A6J2JUI4_BOMMA|nr:myb/SANT-like DNA-binding domain-containing protein 3 [Bombyx mandarina]
MDSEVVRGKPLSKDETKALIELIENSRIITTKTTNATNNSLKKKEWHCIAERFNANTATCRRTPQQLRLKWENLKKNCRKYNTKIRMNRIKTGGGVAEYIPPDEILDRVGSLLGSTVSGFVVPFGGDREPEMVIAGCSDCANIDSSCEDARVLNVEIKNNSTPPVSLAKSVVLDCELNDNSEVVLAPDEPHHVTFTTPRREKKKRNRDEGGSARNVAIAEYYTEKKKNLKSNLLQNKLKNKNIKLENKKLNLEIEKLKLENQKLKLENQKLNIELEEN